MTSFYTKEELFKIGFNKVGDNVNISRKTSIYSADKISIGNNVRIDDFCILSGNISLGSNIHISAYCALYGSEGILFEDYTGMSPYSVIYSAMDDFSGDYLIGPIHDIKSTNVIGGPVFVKKYSQIGTKSVVFPNLTLNEGCVIGANSLVLHDIKPWTINIGSPTKVLKIRNKGLLNFISSFDKKIM